MVKIPISTTCISHTALISGATLMEQNLLHSGNREDVHIMAMQIETLLYITQLLNRRTPPYEHRLTTVYSH